MNSLSNNAANAALRNSNQRTMSLSSLQPPMRARNQSRASSLRASSINSQTSRNGFNSPSSKIVKTVRETGSDGRTISLTRTTIQRMGSFEVVKTTTFSSPNATSSAGSIFSAGESELNDIAEEFEEDFTDEFHQDPQARLHEPQNFHEPQPLPQAVVNSHSSNIPHSQQDHRYRELAKKPKIPSALKSQQQTPEPDSESIYSDAADVFESKLPNDDYRPRPSITSNASSSKKSVRLSVPEKKSTMRNAYKKPQRKLSQQEMYEQAYKVAHAKVHGDGSRTMSLDGRSPQPRSMSLNSRVGQPSSAGFRSYSLRDPSSSTSSVGMGRKERKNEIREMEKQRAALAAQMASVPPKPKKSMLSLFKKKDSELLVNNPPSRDPVRDKKKTLGQRLFGLFSSADNTVGA